MQWVSQGSTTRTDIAAQNVDEVRIEEGLGDAELEGGGGGHCVTILYICHWLQGFPMAASPWEDLRHTKYPGAHPISSRDACDSRHF